MNWLAFAFRLEPLLEIISVIMGLAAAFITGRNTISSLIARRRLSLELSLVMGAIRIDAAIKRLKTESNASQKEALEALEGDLREALAKLPEEERKRANVALHQPTVEGRRRYLLESLLGSKADISKTH